MDTQKKNGKALAAVLILSVVAAVYIGAGYYFTGHFFPRTTVNGKNVGWYSLQELKNEVTDEIHSFVLSIQTRDGSMEKITGSSIGLEPEWDHSPEQILNGQKVYAWPLMIFRKNELAGDLLVNYDEERLQEAVDGLFCMDTARQTEPEDAGVVFEKETDSFGIKPCVQGTRIDTEKMNETVANAVKSLRETLPLDESGVYIAPGVYEDDERLKEAAETMNRYAGAKITFTIGKKTQVLDVKTFHDWIKLDKHLKPVINKEKIAEYVDSLARTYNSCYSKKKLKTSYGVTVEIPESHYGWKVDCRKEEKKILSEIKKGKKVTRDLNYLMTANSHGKNDYGKSYVEINLTAQHLFLYKNGKLILDTDFVSGNLARNNGTPTGAYGITYTKENAVLRGEDYETPVNYWMPFAGNVGMHDATWRRKFGGNIYKYSGSHGCVNLPVSAAKKIYANVETNYPVLVYELPGSEKMKPVNIKSEKKKTKERKK